MEFPNNLKYSNDHEWVKVEAGIAYIGITAHAANELGEIVYLDIESDLSEITKGDVFGVVEAVKTVSDLVAPISGKVLEINTKLNDNPAIINSDAYNEGWMLKVELANEADLNDLLSSEAYQSFIGE